jgi:glycine/D-amino acid oxidase-like deaminating enzyme
MTHPLFAPSMKTQPYWWDEAPRPSLPEVRLPAAVDVAIVGGGYTGLSAALVLARAGRSVLVLEAEDIGHGCSSRNGGQLGFGLKPGVDGLREHFGQARGDAMFKESIGALAFLREFIEKEQIRCHLKQGGRFIGAHRPAHYEALARRMEKLERDFGIPVHVVPKDRVHEETATDAYHGGAVIENHCALQPALYLFGLLERAQAAGATVSARTPATAIARESQGFTVTTPRGSVKARDVIVATNGYTRDYGAAPDLRRRIIPIGSYMLATEPVDKATMDRLFPKDRVTSDTRQVVLYYRASPDRTRIVFGGRVAVFEADPIVSGPKLHGVMAGIFPELAQVKISHSWMGFVAFTFDHLPHIGVMDGIHYAMGYCGSGVPLGTFFGHKIAHKVMGSAEGRTAFDDLPFQTRPLYDGTPWFLAGAVLYYRFLDRYASKPR